MERKPRWMRNLILGIVLSLTVQAASFASYAAYENTYQNTGDMAQDLIGTARTQLGYQEGSDNYTKYGLWYPYNNGHGAWCAMFVSWCADQADIPTSVIPKHCNCDVGVRWFQDGGQWKDRGEYEPKTGDIIYFGKPGDATHVGIVESAGGGEVHTIEGNASNMCKRNTYSLDNQTIIGYGVPVYNGEFTEENQDMSYPVPVKTYADKNERINTYKSVKGEYSGYIDGAEDECQILRVYKEGWTRVRYPTAGGEKTAYCPLNEFIPDPSDSYQLSVAQNTDVYRKSDMTTKFGVVYPQDKITVVGSIEDKLQVIYPLDTGGYKMGWIYRPAEAEGVLQISGGYVTARPGETVTVPVNIENNPGIMGLGIQVVYDEAALEITGIERGDILDSGMLEDGVERGTEGSFKILWSNIEENKKNGSLLKLKFHVKEEAADGEYMIHLEGIGEDTFGEDYRDIEAICSDGKLDVHTITYGDVNKDGAVNNKDAAMLLRFLVYKEEFDEMQLKAADYNKDGRVNNQDVAKICRFLVGKDV